MKLPKPAEIRKAITFAVSFAAEVVALGFVTVPCSRSLPRSSASLARAASRPSATPSSAGSAEPTSPNGSSIHSFVSSSSVTVKSAPFRESGRLQTAGGGMVMDMSFVWRPGRWSDHAIRAVRAVGMPLGMCSYSNRTALSDAASDRNGSGEVSGPRRVGAVPSGCANVMVTSCAVAGPPLAIAQSYAFGRCRSSHATGWAFPRSRR
jgi:hypothetical protein